MGRYNNEMGRLYLVIDPMPGIENILPRVKAALAGGIEVIQIWNHWNKGQSTEELILSICTLAKAHQVPVIIHEHWQWLNAFPLDGIHFETVPDNFDHIKNSISRPFLVGLTCGNDEDKIQWAIDNKLDYISFCSMFPSSTANSCELVKPELVKTICDKHVIQVYVAGGVTVENIPSMIQLGVHGVAVVSGIMGAADPKQATALFKQALKQKPESSIL